MLQQQQQHIRMFIIIVFIFLSFKWFNLIRRVIKNHSAKVRRNPHSHNTLCMAFLYTIRLVCPPVDYKQSLANAYLQGIWIVPLPPKGCLASPIGDIGVPP